MASEKNLHHFCFWHPPLFNFYIVILLPGTKDIFLPDGLKRFLLQLASPLTIASSFFLCDVFSTCSIGACPPVEFTEVLLCKLFYVGSAVESFPEAPRIRQNSVMSRSCLVEQVKTHLSI